MDNLCAICDGGTTFFYRRKIANQEVVCEDCFAKARTLNIKQISRQKKLTSDEIRKSILESVGEEVMYFVPTKVIGTAIQFDDKNKKILIPNSFGNDNVYNYNDIVSYELLEDDEVVSSGGLGRAAVGGVLFGGAGAVVGAVTGKKNNSVCNSMGIKLTIDNMSQPVVYISFIQTKTETNSNSYHTAKHEAHECLSIFQLICDSQQKSNIVNFHTSVADEILKFKELLDAKIITQEEYDTKKKELLGT